MQEFVEQTDTQNGAHEDDYTSIHDIPVQDAPSRYGVGELRVNGAAVTERAMQTVRSEHTPSRNLQPYLNTETRFFTYQIPKPRFRHAALEAAAKCSGGKKLGSRELP
jgi:hypothetical protein